MGAGKDCEATTSLAPGTGERDRGLGGFSYKLTIFSFKMTFAIGSKYYFFLILLILSILSKFFKSFLCNDLQDLQGFNFSHLVNPVNFSDICFGI